jgi:hypothetical protein
MKDNFVALQESKLDPRAIDLIRDAFRNAHETRQVLEYASFMVGFLYGFSVVGAPEVLYKEKK